MAETHDESFYNCECPVCGKRFHLKPYSVRRVKNPCCSRTCSSVLRKTTMAGEKNHQYGLKGSKNASWKCDKKMSRYGYIQIRALDHPFHDKAGFVFEHRLVAEKCLLNDENSVVIDGKKYLRRDYDVHHINFDRTDNRPENLMVLTRRDHQKLHLALNPSNHDPLTGQFIKDTRIIKYKKTSPTAIEPTRGTDGAAAFDLYADIDEPVIVEPYSTVTLHTNIAFDMPKGYFGAIYARSGLSTKHGIRPATCVSVIDSDYHGEVGVPLHNDLETPYTVMPHDRVSQIIFSKVPDVKMEEVSEFDNTTVRNEGGFGSTGR